MKIGLVEAEREQSDRHDEANSSFPQLCESAHKVQRKQ
jgi:hypothetical protein